MLINTSEYLETVGQIKAEIKAAQYKAAVSVNQEMILLYHSIGEVINVLPIWGVQRESELDEFLSYLDNPPQLTGALQATIDHDKAELAGDFCRGCGYCLPCPAQIDIPNCARMSLLLRRSPAAGHLSPAGQEKMARIDQCIHCNHCAGHCPYGLNTPELLRRNYEDYKTFLRK